MKTGGHAWQTRVVVRLLAILLPLCPTLLWAHDPYEITSVVYVRSNRIELFVEMEFPTGMTLAGQKRTREIATESQFEAALPRLREFAGSFYEITAGHNVVSPLRTNVELGVEDHIRFQVEFAPTRYRPLRFVLRGLRNVSEQAPYGASLTVLDMVDQKVLGQTTLFADSSVAEFPVTTLKQAPPPLATPTTAVAGPDARTVVVAEANAPPGVTTTNRSTSPGWLMGVIILASVGILLVILRSLKARA